MDFVSVEKELRRRRLRAMASAGPASIEIRMIGVNHGQLPENGLLHMEVVVFTPGEVPLDAVQRVIDESTFERRLAQTARRPPTPTHGTQLSSLIFGDPSKHETHNVHRTIMPIRYCVGQEPAPPEFGRSPMIPLCRLWLRSVCDNMRATAACHSNSVCPGAADTGVTRALAVVVAIVLAAATLLAGCRVVQKIDTRPLETTIGALPGVAQASVGFDEDELDSIATLNVEMTATSPQQISGVAHAVMQARTGGSADYLKRLRIIVGDAPTVALVRDAQGLNPSAIGLDAQRLRAFAATVSAGSPTAQLVSNPERQLTMREATTQIPEVLGAARDTLADSASSILLLPADTNAADWRVTLPLPLSEQHASNSRSRQCPRRWSRSQCATPLSPTCAYW
ncbi:hypothetical protein [Mycolicibacterium fortuitum]|uniref:hypothetical protein n=1 Tax=Mycolicibacterium fortuitum TaxID=1766 RepID=UPI00261E7C95|nr:hypothetical protein [Mycolicibacterium fortuitum]